MSSVCLFEHDCNGWWNEVYFVSGILLLRDLGSLCHLSSIIIAGYGLKLSILIGLSSIRRECSQ